MLGTTGTTACALDDRRKHVVFFVETGCTHQRVLGLVANYIDDIVNGDTANQSIVIVYNRRR
jgi:hypothetical protein